MIGVRCRWFLAAVMLIPIVPGPVSAQEGRRCGTDWGRISDAAGEVLRSVAAAEGQVSRPTLQTSRVSPGGHFRVHYDTIGVNVPALLDAAGARLPGTATAYVDSVAAAFEQSWSVIVDSMGYDKPPPDTSGGDERYDVYLLDLPAGEFGETKFADEPFQVFPNTRYVTWIVMDNDFSTQRTRGLPAAYVTAAHEFFHAVQVGSYGFWGSLETYWYELTSTWMEVKVFPGVEDYLFEVSTYMSSYRTRGFAQYSASFPGYERVLFALFLGEHYGLESVRSVWEQMRSRRVVPSLRAALGPYGTSLESAFSIFAVWTFFTSDRANGTKYFRDGSSFARLEPVATTSLVGEEARLSTSFSPLSHGLFAVRIAPDTVYVLVTNTDADAAESQSLQDATPVVVLSRSGQSRPSQQLALGVTGGLQVQSPGVWDIEYFSSSSGDVAVRSKLEVFPNPWKLSGPHDLIVPTGGVPGSRVRVHFITPDFRSVSAGDITVDEVKGGPAVRIAPSTVRGRLGTGVCIVVVGTKETEELTKLVVVP